MSSAASPLTIEVEWQRRKGSYYPFPSRVSEMEDEEGPDDDREMLEFEMTGIVEKVFIRADAKSHTVMVNIDEDEVRWIKSFV